ncbi:MAG TPA: urate oxidase [Pirellulales bacterium]|jgi:urate oxidase|nr:urate oxidase [Pirellulales bacterium]
MSKPVVYAQSYGKSQVRLSRIFRDGSRHEILDLTVSISLEGDFEAAYAEADCSKIVATDTMKNTVYVLASRHAVRSIEELAQLLARHFLEEYAHVARVRIACEQRPWTRMDFSGQPHDHAFLGTAAERHACDVVTGAGGETTMTSGLTGLPVLKTTGSGFSGFLRDPYTTLPDVADRILATAIEASWPCRQLDADWTLVRQTIRATLLDVFADHDSKSVQHTLYEMGRVALDACELIDEISIHMPNQHHLLANLAPFGLKNPNEVFVPTSEPFGNIRATLRRGAGDGVERAGTESDP